MGILEPYQFKFSYLDILENEDIRNWNRLYSGWKTYPQMWVNKSFLGGVDKIKELIASNEFESLLPKDLESKEEKRNRLLKKFEVLLVGPDNEQTSQIEAALNAFGVSYFRYQNKDEIFEKENNQLYVNGQK